MIKKTGSILAMIFGALYTLGHVFSITLIFPDLKIPSFKERFSPIHFMAPGNDFVGNIFRLTTKSVPKTIIKLNGQEKKCAKQVRGLYFNSQRGKRLRPLDQDTLNLLIQQNPNYSGLNVSGGLYTTCEGEENYGIFGAITYTRGGLTTYLVAGTQLNYPQNKIIPNMANSFQYFDNKIPIGYIYDSYGGIGFVGGSLSGHQDLINYLSGGGTIQSGFTYSGDTIVSNYPGQREITIQTGTVAMETMWNLIIQGSLGLSQSLDEKERISFLGNLDEKTVIYSSADINSATVINIAKQKAQQLCQGRALYTNSELGSSTETIICVENRNLTIDLSEGHHANKTIIVKSGHVLLENGMLATSAPLDLFIDKGNLYLPQTITPTNFNKQGFPESPGTNSGLYLKGNFIINGLLLGGSPSITTGFNHKLHLHGKIIMLNTPTLPTPGRIDQIEALLGGVYTDRINLQRVFVRSCGLDGQGSDDSSCSGSGIISTTPLIILNGNYPSNLLQ